MFNLIQGVFIRVPKMLTDVYKTKWLGSELSFSHDTVKKEDFLTKLDRWWNLGMSFHKRIETTFNEAEVHSVSEKSNFKTRIWAQKIKSIYGDGKRVLLIEFFPRVETVNDAQYCGALGKL